MRILRYLTAIYAQKFVVTWCPTILVMLLPWPWQLEKGKEAESMPVQVTVWAQFGLLPRWGVAWGEGEAQVVAHLQVKRVKIK